MSYLTDDLKKVLATYLATWPEERPQITITVSKDGDVQLLLNSDDPFHHPPPIFASGKTLEDAVATLRKNFSKRLQELKEKAEKDLAEHTKRHTEKHTRLETALKDME